MKSLSMKKTKCMMGYKIDTMDRVIIRGKLMASKLLMRELENLWI